jgi:hypothetical protein
MSFEGAGRSSLWPRMAPRLLYTFPLGTLVAGSGASMPMRIDTSGYAAVLIATNQKIPGDWPIGQRVGINLFWNPGRGVTPRDAFGGLAADEAAATDIASVGDTIVVDWLTYARCIFPVLGDELALSLFPWPFVNVPVFSVSVYGIPTAEQARSFYAGTAVITQPNPPLAAGTTFGFSPPMIITGPVLAALWTFPAVAFSVVPFQNRDVFDQIRTAPFMFGPTAPNFTTAGGQAIGYLAAAPLHVDVYLAAAAQIGCTIVAT